MEQLKIATWNVNSIRTRLDAVLAWLNLHKPQVLCIQETKTQDHQFPDKAFADQGYTALFTGQKTYNGVAVLSALPASEVVMDFPGNPDSTQRRFMACTVQNIRLVNVYVPNGSEVGSPQFAFKLEFILRLHRYLEQACETSTPLALVGDFNVAPEDLDVYDPRAMDGEILFHPDERAALEGLKQSGLIDLFRLHHSEGGQYTWWDYRMNAFRRNMGLRIDHIWATKSLAARCTACDIDRTPRTGIRPSDHAPVIATFINDQQTG